MATQIFALSAVRSAIGTFGGSLSGLAPEDLGSTVAREAFALAAAKLPISTTFVTRHLG